MALFSRGIRAALLLSCAISVPSAFVYLYPDLITTCIGTSLQLWAVFSAWLTPPVLFLLMNVVVCALVFSSGFVVPTPWGTQHGVDDENGEVEGKNGREDDAEEEEEEEESTLYPEVLSTFFGEGNVATRRKPSLKRSSSSSSTDSRGRPSFPTLGRSLSERRTSNPNPNPSPRVGPNYPDKPLVRALRPPHTQIPNKKTVTFDMRKLPSAPVVVQARNGYAEDRDVDQRADAFIGNFYQKMRLQQVDPYIERLERSYGR